MVTTLSHSVQTTAYNYHTQLIFFPPSQDNQKNTPFSTPLHTWYQSIALHPLLRNLNHPTLKFLLELMLSLESRPEQAVKKQLLLLEFLGIHHSIIRDLTIAFLPTNQDNQSLPSYEMQTLLLLTKWTKAQQKARRETHSLIQAQTAWEQHLISLLQRQMTRFQQYQRQQLPVVLLFDPQQTIHPECLSDMQANTWLIRVDSIPECIQYMELSVDIVLLSLTHEQHDPALAFLQKSPPYDDTTRMLLFGTQLSNQQIEQGMQFAKDVLLHPEHPKWFRSQIQRHLKHIQPQPEEPGLTGSFSQLSLPELLQMLAQSQKTCICSINNHNHPGRIWMQQGQLIHATQGNATGEHAIKEMLAWTEGTFRVSNVTAPPETISIQRPVEAILLDAFREQDEINRQHR